MSKYPCPVDGCPGDGRYVPPGRGHTCKTEEFLTALSEGTMKGDVDYEVMRLLAPAVEHAREQISTPGNHAGGPCFRADERCRDLLEALLYHECAGLGCSSTSACSPECEASFNSRDPHAEAEYIERLLKLPREVKDVLESYCPDCKGPLSTDYIVLHCEPHAIYQVEAIRDALHLLREGTTR